MAPPLAQCNSWPALWLKRSNLQTRADALKQCKLAAEADTFFRPRRAPPGIPQSSLRDHIRLLWRAIMSAPRQLTIQNELIPETGFTFRCLCAMMHTYRRLFERFPVMLV